MREQADLLNQRGPVREYQLTDRGQRTAERLIDTARGPLAAFVEDWRPDGGPQLDEAIARLAH